MCYLFHNSCKFNIFNLKCNKHFLKEPPTPQFCFRDGKWFHSVYYPGIFWVVTIGPGHVWNVGLFCFQSSTAAIPAQSKDFSVDLHHMVLLHGFELEGTCNFSVFFKLLFCPSLKLSYDQHSLPSSSHVAENRRAGVDMLLATKVEEFLSELLSNLTKNFVAIISQPSLITSHIVHGPVEWPSFSYQHVYTKSICTWGAKLTDSNCCWI